jgi:class 3 adenylate cyclase/dihydrofolate reductase
MRLIVTSFVTLDGVIEGPGFDEHRDGRNAWALRIQDDENEQYNIDLVMNADAILLGRRTWQSWAAFWPTATGNDDLARRINEMPKYVVSRTLERADWTNSTIISGNVADEVRRLKERPGGELLVYGSADLVDELLKHDLIDEYRLLLYPIILGSGKHLFRDRIDMHHLRLVSSRVLGGAVVLLVYEPATEEPTSEFVESFAWTDEQIRSLEAAENVDRVLATVLFTDIVDSTARAAELGDRAWRRILDNHDAIAAAEVQRWNGQLVKATGDGILATFDAPTRALRCAFGLQRAVADLDLTLRAAIHTGEIERRAGDIGGIGVHIASRALTECPSGRIVVTQTVRDLATGTDLGFAALGSVTLRGVPGSWELFEASLR